MTQRSEIRSMFGAFWNEAWEGDEFYEALVTSTEFLFNRLGWRVDELSSFLSRFDVPAKAYKEVDYVLASELELSKRVLPMGSFLMDEGHTLDEEQHPFIWVMPAPTENISVITDSPVNPQIMWHRGADFQVVDGELLLFADPFQDEFKQHVQASEDGELITLVDLWLLDGTSDANYLADHYGRVIGMLTPSSDYYKRILNAVYDLFQEGATKFRVSAFVGALVDTDVCQVDGTVTGVWEEGDRSWVSVGDTLHSCPGAGRALVADGDTVVEGSPLFDVFSVTSGRQPVSAADFPQLVLGPAYLQTPSGQALSFENAPLEVTSYQFPIGGDPDDVSFFWELAEVEAEARGIDLHAAIIGDQKQPWTINPLDFIRANFLQTAAIFISADLAAVPDPEAMKLLRYLDFVLPAGTTYFMNVFANADEEDIPIAADEEEPGFLFNNADELDNITITDYVIGSEKLY